VNADRWPALSEELPHRRGGRDGDLQTLTADVV
jgi:hypothetical protein